MAKYDKDLPKTIEKTINSEIRFRKFIIRKKDKKLIFILIFTFIIISILIILIILGLV